MSWDDIAIGSLDRGRCKALYLSGRDPSGWLRRKIYIYMNPKRYPRARPKVLRETTKQKKAAVSLIVLSHPLHSPTRDRQPLKIRPCSLLSSEPSVFPVLNGQSSEEPALDSYIQLSKLLPEHIMDDLTHPVSEWVT
jgi:hypothetical protein